jgi:hypothetical protein
MMESSSLPGIVTCAVILLMGGRLAHKYKIKSVYLVALPKSARLPILLLTFLGAVGTSVASSTEINSMKCFFYNYNPVKSSYNTIDLTVFTITIQFNVFTIIIQLNVVTITIQ